MQEELINFETAVLAKEKGFEPTISCNGWDKNGDKIPAYECGDYENNIAEIRQSLLQKWLREVHDIDVEVIRSWAMDKSYYCLIQLNREVVEDLDSGLSVPNRSYEEAFEIGLKDALELVNKS